MSGPLPPTRVARDRGVPSASSRFFGALRDPLVVLDDRGRVVLTNPALQRAIGWDEPDMLGRRAIRWVHTEDRDQVRELLGVRQAGEEVSPIPIRISTRDGRWLPVTVQAHSVEMGAEQPALGFVVREVSHKLDLEEQLQKERNYLRALLEQVDVGIIACDPSGRITLVNPAFEAQHAIPAGERSLERWSEHLKFFDIDGVTPLKPEEAPLARALSGDRVHNVEYVVAHRDGEPRVRRANGTQIRDSDGRALGAVVALHDITEQRRAEGALRRQALHDPLTGLPNRALILDRLETALARAQRLGGQVIVYFLDLDNFKVVNDGLGHTVGDLLLIEVARRLSDCLRGGDTVGRIGGDEFIVLCEEVRSDAEADHIAERLRGAVAQPVRIEEYEVRPTASLGVARARQNDTAETLLRDADTAMYLAKERGRNRHESFDDNLRARAVRRVKAEQAILRALEHDGLRVVYQPIVRASDFRVVGAEALVRCYEPGRGLTPPSEFIPVAEAMGLIDQIDAWMLTQVCRQTAAWSTLVADRRLFVSCNVSTRLLERGDLPALVREARRLHGVDPGQISIELTETTLIKAGPTTRRALTELTEDGVQVGIDDFGTGYSSLTYLRDFPVSFVKIDRTFVEGLSTQPGNLAIVEAVCRLSRSLELSVTAEGVETSEQSATLAGLGVDHLQGYLFGPPLSAQALEGLVLAENP